MCLHDIFHAFMISFLILTLQFYSMKDLVIEMLRSIAELMTYGDQHDPSYFEYVTLLKLFSPFSYVGIFEGVLFEETTDISKYPAICFRFFMEKQIISEFVRILSISKPTNVSLQLLQTMSIMIQNLTDKNSICKPI